MDRTGDILQAIGIMTLSAGIAFFGIPMLWVLFWNIPTTLLFAPGISGLVILAAIFVCFISYSGTVFGYSILEDVFAEETPPEENEEILEEDDMPNVIVE